LSQTAPLAKRLLDVMEHDILPLTRQGVAIGNKVFGAAILRKCDLSLVVAETNNERDKPLWHGEVHTIKRFHELPARPDPKALVFLSTHEPWAGFDNFYYFFSHEDSRDSFAIPHDLRILKEVFGLEPGGYRRSNAFWNSFRLDDLVAAAPDEQRPALLDQSERIRCEYGRLSAGYQAGKSDNDIPLN
jgi:tRNA(Arg) A34 adenosine deaminase TadA